MKTARNFKIPSLILAAAVSTGFVFPASAEHNASYLVDLNTRRVTSLGTLGGNNSYANGITLPGRWWDTP